LPDKGPVPVGAGFLFEVFRLWFVVGWRIPWLANKPFKEVFFEKPHDQA
jgi:hypothetical protein